MEEEGLSQEDIDPEGEVILCGECGAEVYPMDWIQKEIIHGRVTADTICIAEQVCVRCFGSTKKLINQRDCEYCNQVLKKK